MKTFEASKKLLRESETIEDAVKETETPQEQNSLLRKLEIFEGQGQSLRLLHTVMTTGFNASAPRLVYSSDKVGTKAIIDRGQ